MTIWELKGEKESQNGQRTMGFLFLKRRRFSVKAKEKWVPRVKKMKDNRKTYR